MLVWLTIVQARLMRRADNFIRNKVLSACVDCARGGYGNKITKSLLNGFNVCINSINVCEYIFKTLQGIISFVILSTCCASDGDGGTTEAQAGCFDVIPMILI
jgi:hypothetical protein